MRLALAAACLSLLFAACGQKPNADGCSPSISPQGKTVKMPHPSKPLSCGIGIQNSNYCEYDANGMFKGVAQEVTGICLSGSTP